MYKPHLCKFIITSGGLDANRNPVVGAQKETDYYEAYFDPNLPKEVVFSPDGEIVTDASAVIYLDRDLITDEKLELKIGFKVKVVNKDTFVPVFSGTIKTFNEDLFHTRIWV